MEIDHVIVARGWLPEEMALPYAKGKGEVTPLG
jgi:hypothetical protein